VILSWFGRMGGVVPGRGSVFARHVPFLLVFLFSLATLAVPAMLVTGPELVIAAACVALIATAAAVALPWHRWRTPPRLLVPIADLAAIALLQAGTGGARSIFGWMAALPLIALASEQGLVPLGLGIGGASTVLLMPYLIGRMPVSGPADLVRLAFVPCILGIAAVMINQLTAQVRTRMAATARLQREQARLLHKVRADARELAKTSALLAESTHLNTRVIEAVTEQSIIATDREGTVEVWNRGAEKMLGIGASQVVGHLSIADLPLTLDEPTRRGTDTSAPRPRFAALVESARSGMPDVNDWTYDRPDGTQLTIELAVTPRRDSTGAIDGFLFVATDMTQAREAARLKDEFVSLISHELRTPLSSVIGYLELIEDDEENPLSADQKQYLEVVSRNANRLLRLVGDLLFTAQVEAGQFSLNDDLFDLRSVLSASVESARPAAASQGIDLAIVAPLTPVYVRGDATRLGQACDNLVSNALKFTPRDGEVSVSLSSKRSTDGFSPRAVVRVSDTGVGIPSDEMDKLFGRFFRASTATRDAIPGVGLGLTITRAIVVAHGGEITVDSVVGAGTAFSMAFPVAVPAIGAAAA
jgi:signal transduction histidine kinase